MWLHIAGLLELYLHLVHLQVATAPSAYIRLPAAIQLNRRYYAISFVCTAVSV
jgi:hypothetical protein